MTGDLISYVVEYFSRRKWTFFTCLFLLLIFLGFGVSRLKLNDSILSSLPKGESFQQFNQFLESNNISSEIVFSLAISDTSSSESIAELLIQCQTQLEKVDSSLLNEVVSIRPDVQSVAYDYFFTNLPYLIDDSYYEYIEGRIHRDSIAKSVQGSYKWS